MDLRREVSEKLLDIKRNTVESCEICGGDGYLPPEDMGLLNPCKCMIVFLYLIELVKSKIPMDYWRLTLDDLQVKRQYKQFVNYYIERMDKAVRRSLGVILFGANGIGKTSLMCEIGKEAVVRGYRVQYFTVQQYIDAVKGDSPIVKEYSDTNVILLDEVDKVYIKKGSSYVAKALEEFLRRMVSFGRTIIACTNYDEETFTQVFGDSTVSMLRRHSKFLEVEGSDYSNELQDSWESMLDDDYNFYSDSILDMAVRLQRSMEDSEREAWEI